MGWVNLDRHWSDTTVVYCDVCGNLLTERYYLIERGGRSLRSCQEADEKLLDIIDSPRRTPWPEDWIASKR